MSTHVPVHSWRAEELGGLDLLHGSFTTHVFSRHTHETYSIGLLAQGAMTFDSRGHTYTMHPGQIGLIHPDEPHDGYAQGASGWTYRNLYPSAQVMQAAFTERGDDHLLMPQLAPVMDDPALSRELMNAHRAFEEGASSLARESLMLAALARLVLKHARRPPNLPAVGQEQAALAQVRAKLEDDLSQNVSLDELAGLVGLNAFTLLRAFRRVYGLPPHAYQVQVRLRHAKRLLRQGEVPVQVALAVGFADQSHLGRHFRRTYGITPDQYRQGLLL